MGGGTDIAGVKLGAQIMMDAASGGWVGGVLDVGVVCGVVSVVCCVVCSRSQLGDIDTNTVARQRYRMPHRG